MAVGIIDLALARVLFQQGRSDAGWGALLDCAADTSASSQLVLKGVLEHHLPDRALATWARLPASDRRAWLADSRASERLLRNGLTRIPFALAQDLVLGPYGEERDGPRLILVFAANEVDGVSQVRVHLVAVREEDGLEFVVDTLRDFTAGVAGTKHIGETTYRGTFGGKMTFHYAGSGGVWLPGLQEVSLPAGSYTIVATFHDSHNKGSLGATQVLRSVVIPDSKTPGLFASALMLGWPQSGVVWRSATRTVPMNPIGQWPGDGVATMYSQLRGLAPDQPYQVTVQLFAVDAKQNVSPDPTITLSFDEKATGSEAEWYKELGLGQLKAGEYRVQVTVHSGGKVTTTSDKMRVVR